MVGKKMQDLLRHVGCMDQLAGIRRLTFTSGRRDTIRGYEVYNAGNAFVEEGVDDIFHGRIRFIAPENSGSSEEFRDDDYVLSLYGEMRDARLFGEHLVLKREISLSWDSKSILVNDVVENRGFEEQEYMIMYHLNCGYPVVDKGSLVFIPSANVRPMTPSAEKMKDQWAELSEPIDGFRENVFVHSLKQDKEGMVYAGVYNEKLGLGISVSFSHAAQDYMVEWKNMGSGDYVLGLMAANNHAAGRAFERAQGSLKHIKPFEQKPAGVTITVLDGEKDLALFRERFNRCV